MAGSLIAPPRARRSSSPIAALALIFLLPVPGQSAEEPDPAAGEIPLVLESGPLRIRDQFLLSTGFLAFDATGAGVLPAGGWKLEIVHSATNTWAQSKSVKTALAERDRNTELSLQELRAIDANESGKGIYLADGELYVTSFGLHRGIGDRVQLSITVPVISFQGGFGDRIIQDFHDTFGYSQSGRLDAPEDDYTIYIRDGNGNDIYRSEDPGSGLGDIVTGIKVALPSPHHGLRLAVSGGVKFPTGDEEALYGSGSADYGLQVITSHCGVRVCFHASAGAVRLGDSATFGLASQVLFSGHVAGDWSFGGKKKNSVITQVTISQSPFEDLDVERLDDVAWLADVGYKRQLRDDMVLFVAITENFENFGSSLDVGMHIGWNWSF